MHRVKAPENKLLAGAVPSSSLLLSWWSTKRLYLCLLPLRPHTHKRRTRKHEETCMGTYCIAAHTSTQGQGQSTGWQQHVLSRHLGARLLGVKDIPLSLGFGLISRNKTNCTSHSSQHIVNLLLLLSPPGPACNNKQQATLKSTRTKTTRPRPRQQTQRATPEHSTPFYPTPSARAAKEHASKTWSSAPEVPASPW